MIFAIVAFVATIVSIILGFTIGVNLLGFTDGFILRSVANTLLLPFLTDKPKMVYANWGLQLPTSFNQYADFGFIADNTPVVKGENLYQRLDINKEIAELNEIANA